MMRILSICLVCLAFSLGLKSQSVVIPDTNFVTWLQQYYPNCMSGNMLDTTCSDVINATSLDVTNKSITDLTGAQYFDNISFFWCGLNQLTSLPPIPASVINLKAYGNQITSLPALPTGLLILDVNSNQISSLPNPLPSGLLDLSCGANPLTSFPPLPTSLLKFQVTQSSGANFPSLPNPLPPNLELLFCGGGPWVVPVPPLPASLKSLAVTVAPISSLPPLPAGLESLHLTSGFFTTVPNLPPNLTNLRLYSQPSITTLPILPNSIETLIINDLPISSFPNLPNSLSYLGVENTNITTLPAIPASCYYMNIPDNDIVGLPPLPNNLIGFLCEGNQMSCIPTIPQSVTVLNLSGNPFSCLPNYTPSMSSTWTSYPLCQPNDPTNNPSGCAGSEGIAGGVYNDLNNNCGLDSGDAYLSNIPLKIYDSGNNLVGTTQSAYGVYQFMPGLGTFRVELDTANKPYSFSCPNPGLDSTVTLTSGSPLVTDVDFEVECNGGFDLAAQAALPVGFVFPGQIHDLLIRAGDASSWYGLNCSAGVAGTVTVTVTGPVTYQGPMSSALTPAVSGNVYTYTVADFGNINPNIDFGLTFSTDTTAQSGDNVCVQIDVTPTVGDINPSNNSAQYCYQVLNSYDPNKKDVYPSSVLPGYDDWLTYTIYFQNTGTAPAFNIRLIDTLDNRLDFSTFEVLAYSHPNLVGLHYDVLSIRFDNIMLPDSFSDPAGSQGYFSFRIKPLVGLQEGESLPNRAAIYFDFNAPIITNTAETVFETPLDLEGAFPEDMEIAVYPNPHHGVFQLRIPSGLKGQVTQTRILDATGRLVYQMDSKGKEQMELDLHDQPAGVYHLEVITGNKRAVKKMIKL